jgi:hypothetical protein
MCLNNRLRARFTDYWNQILPMSIFKESAINCAEVHVHAKPPNLKPLEAPSLAPNAKEPNFNIILETLSSRNKLIMYLRTPATECIQTDGFHYSPKRHSSCHTRFRKQRKGCIWRWKGGRACVCKDGVTDYCLRDLQPSLTNSCISEFALRATRCMEYRCKRIATGLVESSQP